MLQLLVLVQTFIARRLDNERGATAVEYGVLIAFIGILLITAAGFLKDDIAQVFTDTGNTLNP